MMSGGLGWPAGGWPENVQRVILGEKRTAQAQRDFKKGIIPGAVATPANLEKIRKELSETLKRETTDDDLYSYLMYPQVFTEFARHVREFSDVGVLPTHAFFYGLRPGEEINIAIEEGKSLIVRLVNISEPDKDARRTVTYELNGRTREAFITDKKIAPLAKTRLKIDATDLLQIGAPIPGLIVSITVSVGQKVARGDKLLMKEAMKMQTAVYASADGVVDALHASVGEAVESKDLLVKLRTI